MGIVVLKWVVTCFIGWAVWQAGYERGKADLWAFLAKNYLVLRKGSYSVGGISKKEIKRK